MSKEERVEILSRREEYKRKFKELWESISEEKKHMWVLGEYDDEDEDMCRIQELKRWYLGDRLYKKVQELERDAEWIHVYCKCWCVGNCCLCRDLDYWDELNEEIKGTYDSDVRWLLDNVIREE